MTDTHPESSAERIERRRDLAAATRKSANRVRLQLLILYIALVAVLAVLFVAVHTSDSNCKVTNRSNRAFNAALDQLIVSAATARTITPAQKAERIAHYRDLHLATTHCPAI